MRTLLSHTSVLNFTKEALRAESRLSHSIREGRELKRTDDYSRLFKESNPKYPHATNINVPPTMQITAFTIRLHTTLTADTEGAEPTEHWVQTIHLAKMIVTFTYLRVVLETAHGDMLFTDLK